MRKTVVALSVAVCSSFIVACAPPSSTSSTSSPSTKKKAAQTGETVAVIGDEKITVDDLQKKLEEQSPFVRARYAEADKRKDLLDGQVRFEVLAKEAMARGYADDPEVQDAVKKIIVQKLTREEFDGRVQLKDITDADLQTYFEAHKADYQKPEMVRASIIAVAFGDKKDEAKKAAEKAQKEAADPKKKEDRNAWKDLVTKVSTDEQSKPAAGDIRYLSKDDAVSRFGAPAADWLFSSDENNAVSGVFEGKDAFYVFKRTGKRKAIERTFDQVKNQIKNVVYREKRTSAFNAYVDELKAKFKVETHPEKLDQLKVNVTPQQLQELNSQGDEHGLPSGAPSGLPPGHPPMGGDDDEPSGSGAPG